MISAKTNTKKSTVLETPYFKMWIENEILFCVYADEIEIDLETARLCVLARIEFTKSTPYAACIDMKGIKSVTKEARAYLAKEGAQLLKAGALVIGSALTKMLGNIFLKVDKPALPTRLFTDQEQALEWLKQYM